MPLKEKSLPPFPFFKLLPCRACTSPQKLKPSMLFFTSRLHIRLLLFSSFLRCCLLPAALDAELLSPHSPAFLCYSYPPLAVPLPFPAKLFAPHLYEPLPTPPVLLVALLALLHPSPISAQYRCETSVPSDVLSTKITIKYSAR